MSILLFLTVKFLVYICKRNPKSFVYHRSPPFLSFPFMPTCSVRWEEFPLDLHTKWLVRLFLWSPFDSIGILVSGSPQIPNSLAVQMPYIEQCSISVLLYFKLSLGTPIPSRSECSICWHKLLLDCILEFALVFYYFFFFFFFLLLLLIKIFSTMLGWLAGAGPGATEG